MFGSTVGFSRSVDRMALVGGSNGAISGVTTFSRYVGDNNAQGVIRLVTV